MLTFLEAAVQVLRSSNRPMTTQEIVDEGVRSGLLTPRGKTPRASMSAELYRAIRRSPSGPLRRVAIEGDRRAVRGSARWTLRE
jgi:HB1, ASXL, restriction endonuclease HTH domain